MTTPSPNTHNRAHTQDRRNLGGFPRVRLNTSSEQEALRGAPCAPPWAQTQPPPAAPQPALTLSPRPAGLPQMTPWVPLLGMMLFHTHGISHFRGKEKIPTERSLPPPPSPTPRSGFPGAQSRCLPPGGRGGLGYLWCEHGREARHLVAATPPPQPPPTKHTARVGLATISKSGPANKWKL